MRCAKLLKRVTIVDYVDAVINNNGMVRGAAAEYNEHVFGGFGKPGDYPVEMLLDRDEKLTYDGHELKLWQADGGEERTVITGPTGTHGAPSFVDRILATSEGAFMGAQFPTVGTGPHSFPKVDGATVATTRARGAQETTSGAVTINDVTAERVQHSYEIDSGDELRLPGVFGYMARDLRRSLASGIDNKVIDALVTANPNGVAASSTTETLAFFMGRFAGRVDGRSARTVLDVRVLLGTIRQNATNPALYPHDCQPEHRKRRHWFLASAARQDSRFGALAYRRVRGRASDVLWHGGRWWGIRPCVAAWAAFA